MTQITKNYLKLLCSDRQTEVINSINHYNLEIKNPKLNPDRKQICLNLIKTLEDELVIINLAILELKTAPNS